MIYRELGRTGRQVSVVGFGGMRFHKHEEATALATVRRCLEVGINFFETGSYGQGKSEVMLGRALSGHARRDEVVLANKAGVSGLPTGDQVRRDLEASLEREGVDYFDLFSFWGTNTPEILDHVMKGGPLKAIERARDEGLVRAVGLTTHARPEWILQFAAAHHWDAITLKEHMLYSRQQEAIARLHEEGTSVVVMSPLAGGIVARPSAEIAAELERSGMSAAALGLRYLTSNPGVTSVISGMESASEVTENVQAGAVDGPLTEEEQRLVAFILERTRGLGERFCTSCGYCMPCPQDVNIPGIFRLWNLMRGYGDARYSRLEYGKMRKGIHWADFPGKPADMCVECGECEKKCPERLAIIDDLKKAHRDLVAEE
ncbi:MAG TPA: aldo/keto reductase [Phycisphaerae bacterium]|nr:aldo/keto reductase [Phycisphaerae bacterium]